MTNIDPLTDELLTIAAAAKRLASRPCAMTVFRWIKAGKLAAVKIGAQWYATPAALADFVRATTAAAATGNNTPAVPPTTPAQRQRRKARAVKDARAALNMM